METRIDNEPTQVNPAGRINLGAIVGGTIIGLFSQGLLSLLGLATGLLIIDPGEQIGAAFTIGTTLYLILITLFSVFIAAFATGRFAGLFSKNDSLLHGIATLALLTLISAFTINMGVSNVLNGALSYRAQTACAPQSQQAMPLERQITGAAASMTPQQQRQMQSNIKKYVTSISWMGFITGLIALVVAALGGIMGMKSRFHYNTANQRPV